GTFPCWTLAAAAAGAALDARRGDHGDTVLLVRVTEHASDAHHVPGLFDRLADIALRVHVGLLRRRRSCPAYARSRERCAVATTGGSPSSASAGTASSSTSRPPR